MESAPLSMSGAASSMRVTTWGRISGGAWPPASCGCCCYCLYQPQSRNLHQHAGVGARVSLIRERDAVIVSRRWQSTQAVVKEQSAPALDKDEFDPVIPVPVTHQTASSICKVITGRQAWGTDCEEALLNLGVAFNSYIVLLVLKEMKAADIAWEFFQWVARLEGFRHNVHTYAAIIDSFGRARKVDAIPPVMKHMEAAGVKPNVVVCTSLITAYGRVRNLDEALKVFDSMVNQPGCKPNVVTYTVLMDLLSKGGRHDDAGKIFTRMTDAGCRPSVHTYTVLIHSLGQAGKPDEAEELFGRMSQSKCIPTAITHSALISAYAKAGNAEGAVRSLIRMKAANLKPAISIYQLVVNVLSKAGRTQEADELLSELPKKQVKSKTKEGKDIPDQKVPASEAGVSETEALVQENGKPGTLQVQNPTGDSPGTENGSTNSKGKPMYVQVGGNVIKVRPGESLRAESVSKLVANWGPSAVKVLEYLDIRNRKPEFIVEVLKRLKDPEAAWSFFTWLKAEEGFQPSAFAYNKMIDIVGEVRDLKKVDELLNEMQTTGIEVSVVTFNTIILAYTKAQYFDGAMQVLERMKEYDCQPNVVTYTLLINALAKSGDHEKAMTMYQTMLDSGCAPNNHTYSSVLKVLGYAGKLEDARDLLRKMPRLGVEPNAFCFTAVIMACKQAGNLEMALEVYKEMQESGTKMTRPSAVVVEELLREAGREEEANKLVEAMKQAGRLDPIVESIVSKHFTEKKAEVQ